MEPLSHTSAARREAPSFPPEIAVTWVLFAAVTLAILVTYSRIPADELYHVSRGGIAGGLSRAVVYWNFPVALVSIPILAIVAERLGSRAARVAAVVGVILSAAVFWPGVVTESDLDVRPVNAIAALGVVIALVLTVVAARRLRPAEPFERHRGDVLRIVLAIGVVIIGVPWALAEVGVHLNGVPVLGTIYHTGERVTQPGDELCGVHPAVHFGHHHGMDGVLLVLAALLLSRTLVSVRTPWLRYGVGAYLALMLCYGFGNLANDFWFEQVTKRGWTDWSIPNVTTPKASLAWLVILLSAAALFAVSVRTSERTRAPYATEAEPA